MSATTDSIRAAAGQLVGMQCDDFKVAGPAATQTGAFGITNNMTRFVSAVGTGSVVLEPMGIVTAPAVCLVLNDSANAINLYPAPGEKINGTVNAVLSIAAGAFAFLTRVQANLDWRGAVIS